MQFVQNTPVPCNRCQTNNMARESPLRLADGSLIMEARWYCSKCSQYLKRGVLRIIEEPKK